MELKDILDRNLICILECKTKRDALLELIDLIGNCGKVDDIEKLRENIFYREELMSTGIGLGIAVPHVRMEGVKQPCIAIGINRDGIRDYESIDDEVVRIIVMIVAGKEHHRLYIKLLSQIVSKLKNEDVREKLLSSQSKDEIYKIFSS